MKYGVLNQKNDEYKPQLWRTIDDLYVGGFDLLARAKEYIPQQVGEPLERYSERLTLASYINYLGMVVDAYAANLFAAEPVVAPVAEGDEAAPTIDPFWSEFASDADLRSDSLSQVLRKVFTTAILKKRALIGCDFPVGAEDLAPQTQEEEDRIGASRAYAFDVCPEELLDWEYSAVVAREVTLSDGSKLRFSIGLMKWAILKRRIQERPTPEAARNTFVEEFKVWRLDDSSFARWETYRTEPRANNAGPPGDEVELPLLREGVTSFRQIPLVELVVPDGLWLGNKLGVLALEMFRRRSALHASENRHLFPIPVVNLGPEIGAVGAALPSERQQNPNRGNEALDPVRRMGGLVLGAQDKFSFVSPDGDAYELVDKQLADLVDEFFRVANMMASSISNSTSALGRSGRSKEQDQRGMATVLEAYGAIVRDAITRLYDVITEARKEDTEWKVHGLDKFDVVDRQVVLDEAKSLSLVSIPSSTFRTTWQTKIALALLGNTTPEQQAQIQKEIKDGVAAEEQMRELMLDGMSDDQTDDSGEGAGDPRGEGGQPPRAPNRPGTPPH